MRMRSGFAIKLILLELLAGPARAQTDLADAIVRCDGKFSLCRYVDRKTQQELIPARFELALPFSEGLAAVRINGRFGYIDARGDVVIAPAFDLAGEFHAGLAEIRIGGDTGMIDRTGKIVVPPMFGRAIPLSREVILATEAKWESILCRVPKSDRYPPSRIRRPISRRWILDPRAKPVSHQPVQAQRHGTHLGFSA